MSLNMTDLSSPRLQLRPVKLASLSDQIYDHLRTAIIAAEIPPGEKLVELDIAAQMGTSQGPVREALQRLEGDGLVERRSRSATVVTRMSMDEMYELFSIRSLIEGFAAQRAAQTITADQCCHLDDLIEQMAQSGSRKEMIPLAEYDMQFHRYIVELSGGASLLRAWTPLSNQIQRFVVQTHPKHYADLVEVGIRHQPIVAALRAQDGDLAAQLVQAHIMLIWS